MARVCFALKQTTTLPTFLTRELGDRLNETVAALVLDRVLEIEVHGCYQTGANAYTALFKEAKRRTPENRSLTAKLAIDALKYAQMSAIGDAARLSARLYFFNRLPFSPEWARRFPNEQSVLDYLGVLRSGKVRNALEENWTTDPPSQGFEGWRVWKAIEPHAEAGKERWTYKLYVSPRASMSEAFREALAVATELRTPAFKVGTSVQNALLRPDKIILYVSDPDQLKKAATLLRKRLNGLQGHGVPFSASIDDNCLLSWGMDPPKQDKPLWFQERESWRLWVTNRLASALIEAKTSGLTQIEPWEFALDRLSLEGVDVEAWTPGTAIRGSGVITS